MPCHPPPITKVVTAAARVLIGYSAADDFTAKYGVYPMSADLWSLIVNGMMTTATVELCKTHRGTGRVGSRWAAWVAFGFGVSLSLCAGIAAAPKITRSQRLPGRREMDRHHQVAEGVVHRARPIQPSNRTLRWRAGHGAAAARPIRHGRALDMFRLSRRLDTVETVLSGMREVVGTGLPVRTGTRRSVASQAMQRIVVIGCGGSGKTHLANQLANLHDLPLTHLSTVTLFLRPAVTEFLRWWASVSEYRGGWLGYLVVGPGRLRGR